jgi:uncharacterized beta barrel domain-containing protein DUF5777
LLLRLRFVILVGLLAVPVVSFAQAPAPAPVPIPDPRDGRDMALNLVEPDFTTVNLPTTLRLPRMKSAFRVTHRFARSLSDGSFGDLASDLFGIDRGAQIGLEYRIGVMRGLQAGINRTSTGKTIQFFGQYDTFRQSDTVPVTMDILASVEGINNFHKGTVVDAEDNEYATTFGVLLSRTIGDRAALYLQPSFIYHSNTYTTAGCLEHLEHGHEIPGCTDSTVIGVESNTLLVGLSSRVRLSQGVYLVGSWTPRASGFRPGVSLKTFGIEKRLGGHAFQLNFSNSLGTTMAQHARGASNNSDWFMGFNISRKFF